MSIVSRTSNRVLYLEDDQMTAAGGVAHGFSTRLGGVSEPPLASMNLGTTRGDNPDHVLENYRLFCGAIGANHSAVAMSNQVHSDIVRVVTRADRKANLYDPEGYEADGLITDVPGIALTVFSADCIPVLLYDPARQVIAALHAGWRGTASGIVARGVERMVGHYGCRPETILAAIGPGISACCFETHEDVPNAMTAALGATALPYIKSQPNGKFNVDLKAINQLWLTQQGLLPQHISVAPQCTVCQPDTFWSHRVHGTTRGSQAAIIQLL